MSRRRRSAVVPWCALLVMALAAPAWAQPAEVNGSIDVSAVQAEVDGEERNTLQQRYSINLARDLTSTLRARASFRYFDFDIDGAEQFGAFREEIQPSAELAWRTEWFRSSVTALRRSIRSSATSGRLVTENVVADWRSAIDGWPMLTLRYDWQKISEEDGGDDARDTRDRRFLARLNVDRENEIIEYGFTRRWTENLIRGLESRENSHQFRFLGSHSLAGERRLRLDTQYLFTYRDRVDEVRTGTVLLEQVTTGQSLFAIDPSPELGTLQPVPGLADGNTGTATVPGIEIGTGSIDRNIGTDLGFEREAVSAMYVYVDRFSSATVDWSVYVSDDGIEWNEVTDTPIETFNTALLRYEIEFMPVSTRYLKVVNGGTNDAPVVFVTEIEVYEALQETGEVSREATTHLANTTLSWRATESLDVTLDASARLEPAQGTVGDREGYDYAARARWQMVDDLQWSGRWEQAWQ
ncbi:MAG TPA: discoidin domain-containing protein, partial [Candidatus Krumholzibacteria bacterium]|nr:discoidin domain-containing protein [Candidatus Krumholzibacteria bacterium]